MMRIHDSINIQMYTLISNILGTVIKQIIVILY